MGDQDEDNEHGPPRLSLGRLFASWGQSYGPPHLTDCASEDAHGLPAIQVQVLREALFCGRQSASARAPTHRRKAICVCPPRLWENVYQEGSVGDAREHSYRGETFQMRILRRDVLGPLRLSRPCSPAP
ncbi:hypothetical protein RSOL_444390 [Rhizoctonia solani AG-3 Rhs1AP]|uniref:Uncharacterized protein n=1 Tax=Rhizoctonia solani AG-3 Rhs1AP TaxID=1086054 RepID=X8JNM1_9AGAM|nr:hypothetical protein RSOL_444390 [Rhizoctonia solani AG-3 Rhs1AP]